MIPETQTITIETVVGPKDHPAPDGWDFSPTMRRRVWIELLRLSGVELTHPQRDQPRANATVERRAKIGMLSILLANDLGMSSYYWAQEATRIASAAKVAA